MTKRWKNNVSGEARQLIIAKAEELWGSNVSME